MENEGQARITEAQILERIQDLEQQGLVDSMLRHCYTLKEENGPYFFATLLPTFSSNVSTVFENMIELLKVNVVDFTELCEYTIKLEGSAGCFGAARMREACSNLRRACENKSKEGCIQAFGEIKCEYGALRTHLDIILKLEGDLISSQTDNSWKSPASASSAT